MISQTALITGLAVLLAATVTLVIPRTAPPAVRTPVTLFRTRANRDHHRPVDLVEIDLLDHRSPQSEQRLPYPEWAHVATVPLDRFQLSEAGTVGARRRAPPPARRSGAPSAPTSPAQSADGGGCQAAPPPPRAAKTSRRHRQHPRRCLIRRRRPRYPAPRSPHPRNVQGSPISPPTLRSRLQR